MVLEPGQRLARPRAVEQHVADHAPVAGHRLQRQEADPGQLVPGDVPIRPSEQLIAPADGKDSCSARYRLVQGVRLRDQVVRDERLLTILAAADVEEVDLAAPHRLVEADRPNCQFVATQGSSLREHGDVAAVGVDVQVVGIEVSNGDPHAVLAQ